MNAVTVSTGARLHFGFQNLSLARERLYGGIGVGLDEPRLRVVAEPADSIDVDDPVARTYTRQTVELLDVSGASVTILDSLPRHVGLGSGTQLALAVYAAVSHAHDIEPKIREHAPILGRGGRSGVGVGTFIDGGFVVDAGHPTSRFTTEPPADGDWTVPSVVARHELPETWRFLVVIPDGTPGRSGEDEDASIRSVVERADPSVADDIAGILTRKLLPATADGRLDAFSEAISTIGHKNGVWYADAQGGVFRPPAGELVTALETVPVISGLGQSSWGPAVYGVTDSAHGSEARSEARAALEKCGLDGNVHLVSPSTTGARIE